MEKSKVFAAAALCAVVLASTGCAISAYWRPSVDCHKEPYRCRSAHEMQKSDASPLSVFEVEAFDPARSAVDVSESNVEFVGDEASFVVSATRNGVVSASPVFSAMRVGKRYLPANAAAIKAWLRENAVGATSVQFEIRGMQYVDAPGANLVSVRTLYDGVEMSGATTSWYLSTNDDMRRTQ